MLPPVTGRQASITSLLESASRLRLRNAQFKGLLGLYYHPRGLLATITDILCTLTVPVELLAIASSHAYNFSTYPSLTKNRNPTRLPVKPGKLKILQLSSSRNATNQATSAFATSDAPASITLDNEDAPSSSKTADQAFRRLEKHLHAPYPRQLIQISNEYLRREVFRETRPNGYTVSPELPQAYYHTALEKKGDDLTRMIADEVAIYWFLQFSYDYNAAAKFLHAHNYQPVSALIRNTHWTVLCTFMVSAICSGYVCCSLTQQHTYIQHGNSAYTQAS